MSTLREILKEEIDREIEGVIKANDTRRIRQEVQEYVVTAEIAKVLRRLFSGYAESIDRQVQGSKEIYPYNGAWISGYFGSGKSHLLKILAYLMESDAEPELRHIFLEKIPDEILRGDIAKAFATNTLSVIFNIEQQADAESDDQSHVILFVFEKVFNRALGYCDDDRIVADFEREIDERGEYDAFKRHFEKATGYTWVERRTSVATIDRKLFADAWASFRGIDEAEASAVLDRYEASRSLTTEKFARQVKAWLDRQENPKTRINFYVDEVGRFIANHPQRMLSLQTVAESLATICDNRAWIFVTSQEDLDAVIGDATREQRNDFSIISARFYFRLPLTSSNVEEVIQKRLLAKTEPGYRELATYYKNEADHLRTVFHFGEGVKDIRFKDEEHFSQSYPFLPFHFHYLHESLKGLSTHNAFTGRHVARGERSMLEVFQEVGKQLADTKVVHFATFDRMFDGIRQTLQSGLLTQINVAEENVQSPLAVRLLKALLMLKYVDFSTSADHLTTLLIEAPEQDRAKLGKQVQEALDLLQYQSYLQRNGDVYEYLTDPEKEVEIEIKNVPIEYTDLRKAFGQIVVDRILKTNKITYEANKQDYQFAVWIDDEQYRKAPSELSLQVITQLHPNADDITALQNQNMGKKQLMVVLDVPAHVDDDLRLFHQTRTFLNHNTGSGEPQRQRIINDKRAQNAERERRLYQTLLPALLESATFYAADRKVDIGSKDSRQRIVDAFQELVKASFPLLRILKDSYDEGSIREIILPSGGSSIFSGEAIGLGEDEAEMQAFLERQRRDAKQTTVTTLKDHFSGGQYGWYEWAILGVLAKLYARDAAELVEGARVLGPQDVVDRLTRGRGHDQVIVRLATPIDSTMVNELAKFYQDFFHKPATATGGKELMVDTKQALLELRNQLRTLAIQAGQFPFLGRLSAVSDHYDDLANKEFRALAKALLDDKEELLQEKLETVDSAIQYMQPNGGREHYERIRLFIQGNRENFALLGRTKDLEELEAYLESDRPWGGQATRKALDIYKEASESITDRMEDARKGALDELKEATAALQSLEVFGSLSQDQQNAVLAPLSKETAERIRQTASQAVLENIAQIQIPQILQRAREEVQKAANPKVEVRYASPTDKKVSYVKNELVTEADVDGYVEAVRKQYKALINEGKRIGL